MEESSEKERAENLRSYTEVARSLIDLGATTEHVFNWLKSFSDFHLDDVEFDADAVSDYDDLPDDDPWGGGGISTANNADFDESKHPRAPDGKFGTGSGDAADKGVDTGGTHGTVIRSRVRSTIRLTKEEYGKITHELNNNLSTEERDDYVLNRAIGNHVYTIQNNGFNEYTVLRKVKL